MSEREKIQLIGIDGLQIVLWNGQRHPIESVEAARKKWIGFRELTKMPRSKIGDGVKVVDKDGHFVARIDYGGNLFFTES